MAQQQIKGFGGAATAFITFGPFESGQRVIGLAGVLCTPNAPAFNGMAAGVYSNLPKSAGNADVWLTGGGESNITAAQAVPLPRQNAANDVIPINFAVDYTFQSPGWIGVYFETDAMLSLCSGAISVVLGPPPQPAPIHPQPHARRR